MANMTGNKDDIKNELLAVVQSLRARIQMDVDTGRTLNYLCVRGDPASVNKPPVPHREHFLQAKPCDAHAPIEVVRGELGDCQRCPLGKVKTHIVFGEGNEKANLVFVGEAPGADEDTQGRPFVGRAGQLLTKIISAMGLSRNDVYICNILKCRPPGNRNPKPDEIHACEPFLIKQLQAINPEVICALGTFAAQTLLKKEVPITALRGRFHSYQGIKVMPTYHPAYLLRNAGAKKLVWEDMQMIMKMLGIEKKEA